MESSDAAGAWARQTEDEVASTLVEVPAAPPTDESPTMTEGIDQLQLQSNDGCSASVPDISCTNPFEEATSCGSEIPAIHVNSKNNEEVPSSFPSAPAICEAADVNSVASWLDTVAPAEATLASALARSEEEGEIELNAEVASTHDRTEEASGSRSNATHRDVKSVKAPKRRRAASGAGEKVAKRKEEDATASVALHAFKQSQRSLRKEAKGLSMKEVLSRSQTASSLLGSGMTPTLAGPGSPTFANTAAEEQASPLEAGSMLNGSATVNSFSCPPTSASFDRCPLSPTGGSSFLSPASPTVLSSGFDSGANAPASSSSPWSPALVSDITRSFLANVERQKRQTVERLLPRDLMASGRAASGKVYSPSTAANRDGGKGWESKSRRTTPPPIGVVAASAAGSVHIDTANTVAPAHDPFPTKPTPSASLTTAVMKDLLGVEEEDMVDAQDPFAPRGEGHASVRNEEYDEGQGDEEEDELDIRDDVGDDDASNSHRMFGASYASEHSMRLRKLTAATVAGKKDDSFLSTANEQSVSFLDGGGASSPTLASTGNHFSSFLPPGANSQMSASQTPLDEASQQQELERQRQREEAAEEAATRAATRRHEIWKLKQRSLKAQRMLQTSTAPAEANASARGQATTPVSNGNAAHSGGALAPPAVSSLGESRGAFESVMRNLSSASSSLSTTKGTTAVPLRPFDVNGPGSPTGVSHGGLRKGTSSIRDVNLSQSDVSMIVRLNSFDRTSSQKVVVFGAAGAAGKDADAKKEQQQRHGKR